jgi:hypothetical protein
MKAGNENQKKLLLTVSVEVRSDPCSPTGGNDHLRIDETLALGSCDFLEIAAILGQFHELAQQIQRQRANG